MKLASFLSAASIIISTGRAQRCGCLDCSDAVLAADAGGYPCGDRIAYLESTGQSEEQACSRVAGIEFPTVCGPSCDPALCDGRGDSTASIQTYCGCASCTQKMWSSVADTYTCGARISYLTDYLGYPSFEACRVVAGDQFPAICGPFCDPALCEPSSPTPEPSDTSLRPTLKPTTLEPSSSPTTEKPSSEPSYRRTIKPSLEPTTERPTTDPTFGPTPNPTLEPSTEIPSPEPTTPMPSPSPNNMIVYEPTSNPSTSTSRPLPIERAKYCGCLDCTEQVWNTIADIFSCGARIAWVAGDTTKFTTQEDACRLVAGTQFPDICGPACDPDSCDGRSPSSVVPTPSPNVNFDKPTSSPSATGSNDDIDKPTASPSLTGSNESVLRCGCNDCTDQAWKTLADGFQCGARIEYLLGQDAVKYPSEIDACRRVAAVEYPTLCGPACNPDRCDGKIPPFTAQPTLAPHTPPLTRESPLYCFPEHTQRTRYENVWKKYSVEVKEGGTCGPGNNAFTTNTVSIKNDSELTMQFKKVGNQWEGSEVRIILPEAEMPYTYGTYSFSVQSLAVLDATTLAVIDTVLPQSLVLGLFTWDDTEIYAIHENWNHEVDIEISRWNIPANPDGQFLVQPPNLPQIYRFYTGAMGSTYDQGGHKYEFTWSPGDVKWYTDAGGGQNHSYATQDAIFAGLNDYVQCLPADVEVRINLWNMFGSVLPVGMNDDQLVEVVIDDFSFTPSGQTAVMDGGYCTKGCQCDTSSICVNGICTAAS